MSGCKAERGHAQNHLGKMSLLAPFLRVVKYQLENGYSPKIGFLKRYSLALSPVNALKVREK